MIALVLVSTFAVLVLGFLVAGLLRSHADILRSLHELGVGVGDPALDPGTTAAGAPLATTAVAAPSTLPPTVGQAPPLGPAPTVAGQTPDGDARAISVNNSDGLTLLAFLSSGCATCVGFWDALQRPGHLDLPATTRAVIVTKGADREVPGEVRARTTGKVPVVMSTEAWVDYQVPGSPFFVLVDGATGTKVGQGVASHLGQLAELVRRAEHDRDDEGAGSRGRRRRSEPSLGGPAREAAADDVLRAAGIQPGDPSLYPRTLEDVFPHGASPPAATPSEGPARG